jgi:hypothetical protein
MRRSVETERRGAQATHHTSWAHENQMLHMLWMPRRVMVAAGSPPGCAHEHKFECPVHCATAAAGQQRTPPFPPGSLTVRTLSPARQPCRNRSTRCTGVRGHALDVPVHQRASHRAKLAQRLTQQAARGLVEQSEQPGRSDPVSSATGYMLTATRNCQQCCFTTPAALGNKPLLRMPHDAEPYVLRCRSPSV